MLAASVLLLALSSLTLADASTFTVDFKKQTRHSRRDLSRRDTATAPLIGTQLENAYYIEFELGTPPQKLAAQFDTGSSDIWVAAANTVLCRQQACMPPTAGFGEYIATNSSTYQLVSKGDFVVVYGSEAVGGNYATDVLTLGSTKLDNFTFGVGTKVPATATPIFGVGMDAIQASALAAGVTRPGLLDRMLQAGLIDRRVFSMFLNSQEAAEGSVVFGGIDHTKYTGDLVTLPMAQNASGVYDRYRLDLTSVTFTADNGNVTNLTTENMAAPVILDSGVTTLLLPPPMAKALYAGFGAVPQQGGAFYAVDCAYRKSNGNLTVQFSGASGPQYDIPVKTLISDPEVLNQTFPNGVDACYFFVQAGTELTANGLGGYSLGDPFLRNMYVVYDIDNHEISLAKANWDAPANGQPSALPSGTSVPGVSSTASGTPTQLPALTGVGSGSSSTSGSARASGQGSAAGTAITGTPASPTLALATTAAASSAAASSTSNSAAGNVYAQGSGLAGVIALLGLVVFGNS